MGDSVEEPGLEKRSKGRRVLKAENLIRSMYYGFGIVPNLDKKKKTSVVKNPRHGPRSPC